MKQSCDSDNEIWLLHFTVALAAGEISANSAELSTSCGKGLSRIGAARTTCLESQWMDD